MSAVVIVVLTSKSLRVNGCKAWKSTIFYKRMQRFYLSGEGEGRLRMPVRFSCICGTSWLGVNVAAGLGLRDVMASMHILGEEGACGTWNFKWCSHVENTGFSLLQDLFIPYYDGQATVYCPQGISIVITDYLTSPTAPPTHLKHMQGSHLW